MKSIVFCSSQRFKKELEEFMAKLRASAHERNMDPVILSPEFEFDDVPEGFYKLPEEERLKNKQYRQIIISKVYDHLFRKIRVADVCFIFNKDGYLGPNVIGELFTAAALGKMIYALDERCLVGRYPNELHEEPCCRGLVHQIISNPEELLKYLA
jgi:hypothetical protein